MSEPESVVYIRQKGAAGFEGIQSLDDLRNHWNRLMDAAGGTVRAVNRDDGRERWSHKIAEHIADFAYDADYEQLLLSNGDLISARGGKVVEMWPALADCCCVRRRPEGGFVGVSKAGTIGVWDVNS